MRSACSASGSFPSVPGFNATEIFLERLEKSPKDHDRERLKLCWGKTDCGDCHRSPGFCGWCAISSTCLPLPNDSAFYKTFPLLSPIAYHHTCAYDSERFELRTSGLGCQVSTITFLTSVVTIFITLGVLLLGWLLFKLVKWVRAAWRATRGGWMVRGDGSSGPWVRGWRERNEGLDEGDGGLGKRIKAAWYRLWRAVAGRKDGRDGTAETDADGGGGETRPLLG